MISHGASKFLKERLFEVSDFYTIFICKGCGNQAISNKQTREFSCLKCANSNKQDLNAEIVAANIPYACKLLF